MDLNSKLDRLDRGRKRTYCGKEDGWRTPLVRRATAFWLSGYRMRLRSSQKVRGKTLIAIRRAADWADSKSNAHAKSRHPSSAGGAAQISPARKRREKTARSAIPFAGPLPRSFRVFVPHHGVNRVRRSLSGTRPHAPASENVDPVRAPRAQAFDFAAPTPHPSAFPW